MKIALVNFEPTWKDIKSNLVKKENHIKKVLELFPETQVVVFPELSFTGYVLDEDNKKMAEDENGFCVSETKKLAIKYWINIIAGFIEKNWDKKPFNSSMVVSKKWKLITTYAKTHLFSQCPEPDLYSSWESLKTFELEWIKCWIYICFDNRYPKLFEKYKKAWVQCLFWPHAWVSWRNKKEIFNVLTKARAHENQYFIAWVDCIGSDKNTSYTWSSCISTPFSEDIKITKEKIYHYAEINLEDIEKISKMLPLWPSYLEDYNI